MNRFNDKRLIYSVNFWQAHPNSGEDACSTGVDYDTLVEAKGAFEAFSRGQVPANLGDLASTGISCGGT